VSREAQNNENPATPAQATSKVIDWFHEGEAKVVEIDGVRMTVRFIGRKGRRGRIAIEAPAGAEFQTSDRVEATGVSKRTT
jgi:hypothetical protein